MEGREAQTRGEAAAGELGAEVGARDFFGGLEVEVVVGLGEEGGGEGEEGGWEGRV